MQHFCFLKGKMRRILYFFKTFTYMYTELTALQFIYFLQENTFVCFLPEVPLRDVFAFLILAN